MLKLDFPEYNFRMRTSSKGVEIFDIIRKKFISLMPEEWVRQHMLRFLIEQKQVPVGRINVEVPMVALNLKRRADIVVFNDFGNPLMIIECKAPNIKITQTAFEQIARYNIALKARYFVVTNGLEHFCCFIDYDRHSYSFLAEIPCYHKII